MYDLGGVLCFDLSVQYSTESQQQQLSMRIATGSGFFFVGMQFASDVQCMCMW